MSYAQSMRNHDYKSKNLNIDNYVLNLIFSITIAYAPCFKFCLDILQTHLEGTVSQIFYVGPSFDSMPKIGKHCEIN